MEKGTDNTCSPTYFCLTGLNNDFNKKRLHFAFKMEAFYYLQHILYYNFYF